MDADELDKMCKEFNEFMKKRKENGERIGVMPQILMHEELIDTLVAQGTEIYRPNYKPLPLLLANVQNT